MICMYLCKVNCGKRLQPNLLYNKNHARQYFSSFSANQIVQTPTRLYKLLPIGIKSELRGKLTIII